MFTRFIMDLSFKKSCFTFVIVVDVLLFVVARINDPAAFQGEGEYLSSREISKDHTIIRRLLADDDMGYYCSKENIYISQGQSSPLPDGIPTYTVQIQNICIEETQTVGCTISDIHLTCGWFSSARLINPDVFRRVSYDDCLVNNGNPIGPGQTIAFQYANTYPYPMSVSSLSCY